MSTRTGTVLDAVPTECIERVAPEFEKWMAALVVGFYFAGDVATTIISMENGGVETTGSIAAAINEFGYAGLVAHKLVILGIVAGGWLLLSVVLSKARTFTGIPPHGFRAAYLSIFAFRGVAVTVWNCYIIALLLTGHIGTVQPPAWV